MSSPDSVRRSRSVQQPRLRDGESMEELSAVEYNRKKKLTKKAHQYSPAAIFNEMEIKMLANNTWKLSFFY